MKEKYYLCIDLKSYFASVECVERGLDPMQAKLVVADPERTEKTICLAVSPAMKALGVKNRCRVFEIPKNIDYIMAPPRMQKYVDYAAEIYGIYLEYISKDDIYVYSIDESFMDITPYLRLYNKTPHEMAIMLMEEVRKRLGIRATAGIGTNLYLAKIALDITAKHSPDFIGYLDEELYKKELWDHQPITDFWRIGHGIARRLRERMIFTMRDIANADENMLYRMFGIDAELLIDHANGIEPVTIKDIKAYKPQTKSFTSGQVLKRDYQVGEAKLILEEMITETALRLSRHKMVCDSITLVIRYSNSLDVEPAHGTAKLPVPTNSETILVREALRVYDIVVEPDFGIRGIMVSANNTREQTNEQLSFLTGLSQEALDKDSKVQDAIVNIKAKFGKNAMFKARDLEEGATTIERNMEIGGHKSGEKIGGHKSGEEFDGCKSREKIGGHKSGEKIGGCKSREKIGGHKSGEKG